MNCTTLDQTTLYIQLLKPAMKTAWALLISVASLAYAQTPTPSGSLPQSVISAASSASAAAATAVTTSKTSNVSGAVFDYFVQIWLENTDYDRAAGTADFQWLASQGITLTNYFGTTHPSEPNYVAVAGGSYFGIGDDNLHGIPDQVPSVVDLLEERGISYAAYQEDMPYTGFKDFNYTNPATNYVDYVRKHNPLILYNSVANNSARVSNVKNFTLFHSDLTANKLPQWSFMTPNMLNDGHDTTVQYCGNWSRTFLTPLLNNTSFMKKTLVILTFDENETYTSQNRVFTVLLGDVIPKELRGTVDPTFYTHYSCLSTAQANWGLYHLGRGDVDPMQSNVFQLVANKTGFQNANVTHYPYNNFTSSGYFDPMNTTAIPAVNQQPLGAGGRGILPSLKGSNGSAIQPPSSSSSAAAGGATASSSSSSSGSGSSSGSSSAASPAPAGSGSAAVSPKSSSASSTTVSIALLAVALAFIAGMVSI